MFIDALETRFPGAIEKADDAFGLQTIRVASDQSHAVLEYLRDDTESRFDFLTDLTVVHYPERDQPFEVVYHLYSYPLHERLRMKVNIGDGESVRSVTDLWATANWMEREAFDLFGVRFSGHPDLRRILLPSDWEGHPLRKEHYLEYKENDWVRKHLVIREVHPETDQTGKYELTDFVKANR